MEAKKNTGNVLRKDVMPVIDKPIFVVKVVSSRFHDRPGFTQMEIDWIKANVKERDHVEFLWKARLDDPLYQCLPNSYFQRPDPPPPSEATKAAMQECFNFVGGLSKRAKNT